MKGEPDFLQNLRNEMGDGRQWLDRAIVIVYAVLAGRAREVLTAARVRLANRVAGGILMLGGVWLAFVNKA